MSTITDIRCVLTQEALGALCDTFHFPEEVHPVLPDHNDTMHERLASKIGLYTRFFYFANFRLPMSTFLVDVLRIVPTVGLFRCFYVNSKKSGWLSFNNFACPVRFPWHTAKTVTKDPAPVANDFNSQDYATLVAHPAPFWKFPEEFLCLVGLSRYYTLDDETYPHLLDRDRADMDLLAFIHAPDPTKVKFVERERNDASVDKLFDEGGSGNQTEQGDSVSGGRGVNIQQVNEATDTIVEDVAPLQPRRQRKRKTVVADASEASHPPKKLRGDHGTPNGPSAGGKPKSALQRLLVGAVLNAEVGVGAVSTLPFVTSSVSTTPERKGGDHTNSVAGLNLRTIGASQRFVIYSDSSHHSGTNVAEAEVDSLVRSIVPIITTATTVTLTVDPASVAKEKPVRSSVFGAGSSSAGGADPTSGGFSDLTGSDFLIGGIRTVIDTDSDL
ncbi:hypothetical protein Tco_1320851 [Tanacetum coccineum]